MPIPGSHSLWLGFRYDVHSIPEEEWISCRHDKTVPYRTMTFIGCAFAVDCEFFFELSAYDEGLDIWGSKHGNIVACSALWRCHGNSALFTHYPFVSHTISDKNVENIRDNILVAEVWMDDYKELYYMYHPEKRGMDVGDLTERKELRNQLKCQSYAWLLENVYKQSVMHSGYIDMSRIANANSTQCFDSLDGFYGHKVRTYICLERPSKSQGFVCSKAEQWAVSDENAWESKIKP